MKKYLKLLLPPVIYLLIKKIYYFLILKKNKIFLSQNIQDTKIYDKKLTADILETWGRDTVWNEILMLINKKSGNILDLACGTGVNMIELQKINPDATIYGCDISNNLLTLAEKKGISKNFLQCIDATQINYQNNFFSYSYSIGSLEHFTENGIEEVIKRLKLNTSIASFHFVPISRKNKNEGWIKTFQTFHNNSVDWWLNKFNREFKKIEVLDSSWNDFISVGKWFLCFK
jgi:SAM-dependent methyltransferase